MLPSPVDQDVVIVGAGIGGLGLACALAGHGLRVTVLEKRGEPGGIDRGDSLLPKVTAVLDSWGALDDVRDQGARGIEQLRIYAGERLLYRAPLLSPRAASPYLVLSHPRIEAALERHALRDTGVRVLRRSRMEGLLRDSDSGRVLGVRYTRGGDSHELRARLVVAADGQRSRVREELEISFERHPYDHAYFSLEAERPPAYEDAMRVHLHEDGGVLVMPRADRVGLGMLVDAGSSPRWLHASDAELSEQLGRRVPLLRGMGVIRQSSHVYELARAHAGAYTRAGAVLIGDAAHQTNPTAGQGMSMAIGDADRLAQLLRPVLAVPGAALTPVLEAFEREQRPRNDRLLRGSDRLARAYSLRGRFWTKAKVATVRLLSRLLGEGASRPVLQSFLD